MATLKRRRYVGRCGNSFASTRSISARSACCLSSRYRAASVRSAKIETVLAESISTPNMPRIRLRTAMAYSEVGRSSDMIPPGGGAAAERRASRMHELVFGMPHGQDGARRLADHFLGHAAQQHVDQAAVPVRAHDDQIDVRLLGELDDLVERRTHPCLNIRFEPLELVLFD